MGQTILKVADGWSGNITGVVRTPFDAVTSNVGVFDLSIDGNRDATTGKIDGFYTGVKPGSPLQDSDIHVARVEVMDCSGYGFDPHEQTLRLTIESSVAHGNGLDGFVADYIVNGIYRNNIAYGTASTSPPRRLGSSWRTTSPTATGRPAWSCSAAPKTYPGPATSRSWAASTTATSRKGSCSTWPPMSSWTAP
jgi:hypothetical protein